MSESYKYYAFISYSHKDKEWGDWLHRKLETYRIPKKLVGKMGRLGVLPQRLYPVFRDREELSSASNLGDKLYEALRESRTLIVICSPHSAKSLWVNEEVIFFKRQSDPHRSRVLCLIVAGEPNAEQGDNECFPSAIRFELNSSGEITNQFAEPIAADARANKDGKENALLKLISGALGVDYDQLKQRDKQRKKQRQLIIGLLLGVLLTIGVYAALMIKSSQVDANKQEANVIAENSIKSLRNHDFLSALQLGKIALDTYPTEFAINVQQHILSEIGEGRALLVDRIPNANSEKTAIDWSNNGKKIAIGGLDERVRIWNVQNPYALPDTVWGRNSVSDIDFVGSDQYLAVTYGSSAESVRIWDVNNIPDPKLISNVASHQGAIEFLSTPRAEIFFSIDRSMRLISFSSKEDNHNATQVLYNSNTDLIGLALSGDDSTFAAIDSFGKILLWDVNQLKKPPLVINPQKDRKTPLIKNFAISPSGQYIIAANGSELVIFDTRQPDKAEKVIQLTSNFDSPSDFSISENSKWLAWIDNNIIFLGKFTNKAIDYFFVDYVRNGTAELDFSPDEKFLTITSENHTKLLDLSEYERKYNSEEHIRREVSDLVNLELGGEHYIAASYENSNSLYLWPHDKSRKLIKLPHNEAVYSPMSVSGDGSVIIRSVIKDIHVWRLGADGGIILSEKIMHDGYYFDEAVISPDGRQVFALFDNGKQLGRWLATPDSHSFELKETIDLSLEAKQVESSSVGDLVISPDGKWLALSYNFDVHLKATTNLNLPAIIFSGHQYRVDEKIFTKDGKNLITASGDSTTRVWRIPNNTESVNKVSETVKLTGPKDVIRALSMSDDGRWLAVSDFKDTIFIYDMSNLESKPITVYQPGLEVTAITFTPDGKYMLTGDREGIIKYWPDIFWNKSLGNENRAEYFRTRSCEHFGQNMSIEKWRTLLGEKPYKKICAEWGERASID